MRGELWQNARSRVVIEWTPARCPRAQDRHLISSPMVLDLATAVVPHEIGDPPHYCVDDRQNRDGAPHRQPYLAAAGYVVAVASEYPIGKGPVCFKHKVAGSVGEKLQNDSDPKRPDVFDDWQHRPSFGGVLFLVE